MLLTKTNIQLEAYSCNHLGYAMTCFAARLSSAGGAKDGVGLLKRKRPVGWGIDSTRYNGTNMVSCKIVTGLTNSLLINVYLHFLTLEHLADLKEALQIFRDPVVLGDQNLELNEERIPQMKRSHIPGPTIMTAP